MRYLDLLKSKKCLPKELPKPTEAPFVSSVSDPSRHILKNNRDQDQKSCDRLHEDPDTSTPPAPGPAVCRGCRRLELIDMDGECIAGCVRQLESGPWREEWHRLPADLKYCKDRTTKAPAVKIPDQQINCQAFEYNSVLMATTPESCREWKGEYCQGCTLSIIQ